MPSRSSNDRYRPVTGASRNVGMPPRSRNHRPPATPDTPTAAPASSLDAPLAISRQNRRSTSRRSEGAPGDFIGDRPVSSFIHPAGPPINTSAIEVLRRPVESAQYLSLRYSERLAAIEALPSVGSRGDSYDNALAESFHGLFKTECIHRDGPWQGLADVELATCGYVSWFNAARLHSACGGRPPAEFEAAYHRAQPPGRDAERVA